MASDNGRVVRNDRIRQVIVSWPFQVFGEKWDLATLCRVARELGCHGTELVGAEAFPTLREHGLVCALATNGMPDPPFVKGLNNLDYHEEIIARTGRRIEECAQAGMPAVIAFNGYKYRDALDATSGEIPRDEGATNTIRGLKELARTPKSTASRSAWSTSTRACGATTSAGTPATRATTSTTASTSSAPSARRA